MLFVLTTQCVNEYQFHRFHSARRRRYSSYKICYQKKKTRLGAGTVPIKYVTKKCTDVVHQKTKCTELLSNPQFKILLLNVPFVVPDLACDFLIHDRQCFENQSIQTENVLKLRNQNFRW